VVAQEGRRARGFDPLHLSRRPWKAVFHSNKEIAEYFRISEDTVRHYLRNIFEKRDVSMRLTLARLAVGVEHISDFVEYLRAMKSPYDESRQRKAGLTPLELEIVAKVRTGYSIPEIAEHLKISEDQLDHYLKNIIPKLGDSDEGDEAGVTVKNQTRQWCRYASSDEERRI
jgi:DNA-binding CsgD family transcriptional regulator